MSENGVQVYSFLRLFINYKFMINIAADLRTSAVFLKLNAIEIADRHTGADLNSIQLL